MWTVDGEVDRSVADVLVFVAQEPGGLVVDLLTDRLEVRKLLVRQMSGELCVFLASFRSPQVQQQWPSRADAGASWEKVSTNLNRRCTCEGCGNMYMECKSVFTR